MARVRAGVLVSDSGGVIPQSCVVLIMLVSIMLL